MIGLLLLFLLFNSCSTLVLKIGVKNNPTTKINMSCDIDKC